MESKKIRQEIEKRCIQHPKKVPADQLRFMKNIINSPSLKIIGLKTKDQREMIQQGFDFYQQSPKEILKIWNEFWLESPYFEVKQLPIFYYESLLKKDLNAVHQAFAILKNWPKTLENWAHSDGLSKIFSTLLEESPQTYYQQFQIWNRSSNNWLVRQSIVGLIYYARARKSVLPYSKIEPMLRKHLHNSDYYVQKGIGWTLRELEQIYPQKTQKFLRDHVLNISPVAFSAAMEKISPKLKEQLKEIRKKNRKNPRASNDRI